MQGNMKTTRKGKYVTQYKRAFYYNFISIPLKCMPYLMKINENVLWIYKAWRYEIEEKVSDKWYFTALRFEIIKVLLF